MDSKEQQDLYSQNPVIEKVDETRRQELVQKARNFEQQYRKLKQSQFFDHQQFYIISLKFLKRWKIYVAYQQSNGNKGDNSKFLGCGRLPIVNEDIVESVNKFDIQFQNNYERLNVVLKTGLQQGKDYIFGTQSMWDIIKRDLEKNQYIEVLRKVVETEQTKKVQLYYQKFTIIPLCNQILKDIEYQKRSTLLSYTVQFSHYATVAQATQILKKQVESKLPYDYTYKLDRDMRVKLWLAPQKTQKQILYNTFLQGCKANATFTYRLYFQGERLEDEKKLGDYDIFDDSIIAIQYKEDKIQWCFFNKNNILVSSCSNCRSVQKLEYFCSCKSVAYCSKQCKIKDKTMHEGRCPNNAESDQQQKQLKLTPQSRRGVVGLRNLGNTCFMNSGLQCISHIIELTQYFLSNKYAKDINKDNPLGTKGQLCMSVAKMLNMLWYGTESSFSPTQVKRAIGKFQPMFSGYNQHDSGQLITYMLDGLHQDLNRVKVKPYVQSKDYDGRPDNIVAAEQWENFLKRNQSQIVDLMYGQYRSVVDCPKCANHSIQFDPFCMCSLPLKNNNLKKLQITYLENHIKMHKIPVYFDKSWNWTMKQVGQEIKKKINKPNTKLMFYVGSYSTCENIQQSRKANQVRSEYKYRSVYARELEDDEDPSKGIKVILAITGIHTYYKDESYRRNISPYRLYYFNGNMSLRDVHHKIFSYYRTIYPYSDYKQEVIQKQPDKPFKLLSIAGSRYSECEYCQKKSCEGCEIPYNDMTLKEFTKNVDEDKIQFQLYCRKDDKQIEKKFQSDSDSPADYKTGQTTLQDCFKLFSEPETLAEDNAWYCPQCKDFVLARKQMQIFKAPKILILCLKRFKRKQYFSQKQSMLVDFPIQNLDLSPFVIKKGLPTHELGPFSEQQQQNDIPLLYDLFAISNHYGSTGGGHYTAFCKNPYTGEWLDFDDSSVNPVGNKKNIVSESAYILFYRRKN